jgi:hypothetical protein
VKAIKTIGLAALASLMAMAFVGASSAMAESTALCKTDEVPCKEANVINHVHETSVGKAVLLTSIGNTECNVLFLGDAVQGMEEGAGLGIFGNFTYTNCVLGGSSCTATEENGPSEIEVSRTGAETASVTGEGLVHVVCSGFIDCSYTGSGLKGTAKGPLISTQKNGEVTLSEQKTAKEAGGFLCPKEAKLDITTTPLEATTVSTPAVDLCVEYEHANGFFLAVSSGVCTTKDAERKGKFGLVRFTRAPALNEMVCVRLTEKKGLWKKYKVGSAGKECEVDDTGNASRYELGTAK